MLIISVGPPLTIDKRVLPEMTRPAKPATTKATKVEAAPATPEVALGDLPGYNIRRLHQPGRKTRGALMRVLSRQ